MMSLCCVLTKLENATRKRNTEKKNSIKLKKKKKIFLPSMHDLVCDVEKIGFHLLGVIMICFF